MDEVVVGVGRVEGGRGDGVGEGEAFGGEGFDGLWSR